METSQNLENVQKTNLKNLHVEFDHLSVVPEENSTENSEKTSHRESIQNDAWITENNIIKPDQSYPSFETLSKSNTLPVQEKAPRHFFGPITPSKSCDDCQNAQNFVISNDKLYMSTPMYLSKAGIYQQPPAIRVRDAFENSSQNHTAALYPLEKSGTDVLVKTDNRNFSTATNSSFSNGGNLEELLNDIESISQDILKLSNPNLNHNGDMRVFPIPELPDASEDNNVERNSCSDQTQATKPYKSELNVVLMPTPMPLLGFDKYKNIQQSCESVRSKSMDNLHANVQNISRPLQVEVPSDVFFTPDGRPFVSNTPKLSVTPAEIKPGENPFLFNAGPVDFFTARYNPENYINKELDDKIKIGENFGSKSNLLDVSSEQVSSENEENLRFKTNGKLEPADDKLGKYKKPDDAKSPKLSIRRKVSIHFKGKKDKCVKVKTPDESSACDQKTPIGEKKHSLFDIKFTTETRSKDNSLQKASSADSKKFVVENGAASELKAEKRISVQEPKASFAECKNCDVKASADGKTDGKFSERKVRKSTSASPDRKHVQVKDEGKKSHKKHRKAEKVKNRRSTVSTDRYHRERSFSVCTDRSNILGVGFGMYDDYPNSDRERTNSLSSCGTIKMRKMSNISNYPVSGKIPWCACWGNGCL